MQSEWEGFFPYYAGYPESFASEILKSAQLTNDAVVLDPWNGSGTTTSAAVKLGLTSIGFDLNPVMIVIARARLLAPSEADSIEPLAKEIIKASPSSSGCANDDPLRNWFGDSTADAIRSIEQSIRARLIGAMTVTPSGTHFERISGLAATFYVALFTVCRELTTRFRASNPTWIRLPRIKQARVGISSALLTKRLKKVLERMAQALANRATSLRVSEQGTSDIRLANSTALSLSKDSIDFVLTSPPYCTRIDYTAATRIELALLHPLLNTPAIELSRQMIGSTRVPTAEIKSSQNWGASCKKFLEELRQHPSKASSGYYYRTHLDYFDKMARSITNISAGLKSGGCALLVVQDSYYKDIHNDLPSIIAEMAAASELDLRRRDNFKLTRSMSGINARSRTYRQEPSAIESVLCFKKL